MAIYDINGTALSAAYNASGSALSDAYDVDGNNVFSTSSPDYSSYSYTQTWSSKSVSNTQGFAIYNDMVFWVSKSGNSSTDASCYVWNLSDGSQALDSAYITIYSGHGNSLSFAFPLLYCSTAYQPSNCYVNTIADDYLTASLTQTLVFDDTSVSCDVCIDETDSTVLWTLGHTGTTTSDPFVISKWDLDDLTDNGDDTYTPALLQSVETAQPDNSIYFQGCSFHDGILWYANGYSGSSTDAYVFGVDPDSGEVLYTIDCETTAEPEGVTWVADAEAVGGYAMYVGFQGMALRKYTFGAL